MESLPYVPLAPWRMLNVSLPPPPISVSSPPRPRIQLPALFPVITLLRSLPVPLVAAVPVKMRFSNPVPSVQLTVD